MSITFKKVLKFDCEDQFSDNTNEKVQSNYVTQHLATSKKKSHSYKLTVDSVDSPRLAPKFEPKEDEACKKSNIATRIKKQINKAFKKNVTNEGEKNKKCNEPVQCLTYRTTRKNSVSYPSTHTKIPMANNSTLSSPQRKDKTPDVFERLYCDSLRRRRNQSVRYAEDHISPFQRTMSLSPNTIKRYKNLKSPTPSISMVASKTLSPSALVDTKIPSPIVCSKSGRSLRYSTLVPKITPVKKLTVGNNVSTPEKCRVMWDIIQGAPDMKKSRKSRVNIEWDIHNQTSATSAQGKIKFRKRIEKDISLEFSCVGSYRKVGENDYHQMIEALDDLSMSIKKHAKSQPKLR